MSYFNLVPNANAKAIPGSLLNRLYDRMEVEIISNWDDTPLPWDSYLSFDENNNILIKGYVVPSGGDTSSKVTIELIADNKRTSAEKFNQYYTIECSEWNGTTESDILDLTLDLVELGWNLTLVNK